MKIPNTKVTLYDYFEFIGKDAVTLADLARWYDAFKAINGYPPKVIIMDKYRRKAFFGRVFCKDSCRMKVNNKIRSVQHYRGVPVISSL